MIKYILLNLFSEKFVFTAPKGLRVVKQRLYNQRASVLIKWDVDKGIVGIPSYDMCNGILCVKISCGGLEMYVQRIYSKRFLTDGARLI